jgi:hypothetical protein
MNAICDNENLFSNAENVFSNAENINAEFSETSKNHLSQLRFLISNVILKKN